MADEKKSGPPIESETGNENGKPALSRRDFLKRSNAGAVAVGVMTGTGFTSTLIEPAQAQVASKPAAPANAAAPPSLKSRKVTLDIDGVKHDVSVDVRESLWETMNYQLG